MEIEAERTIAVETLQRVHRSNYPMAMPQAPSPSESVTRLSNAEREVLRWVSRERGSGEIARILGRSVNTVDNQIKSARAKMGGVDRYTAARLLATAEADSQTQASHQKAMSAISPATQSGTAGAIQHSGQPIGFLAEPAIAFDQRDFALAEPIAEEARVTLSASRRLLVIGGLLVAIGIGTFLTLASVYVVQLLLAKH